MLSLCFGDNKGDQEKIIDDDYGSWKDSNPVVLLHEAKIKDDGPQVSFTLNGAPRSVTLCDKIPVDTSLNTYIRDHANLKGTKFVCQEGGCGVCVVNVSGVHPSTKEIRTWSVNSCLFPLFACHGLDIVTIEGLKDPVNGYHDLQKTLVKYNGSQCGYCTPGMIMQMYSLLQKNGNNKPTKLQIEQALGGNLCRCTGYRGILNAFETLARDADSVCSDIEDLEMGIKKICAKTGKSCAGSCAKKIPVTFVDPNSLTWIVTYNLAQVLAALNAVTGKYMLIHGNTAHGAYRRDPDIQTFIDINDVPELHTSSRTSNGLVFGGNITIADAMEALLSAANADSTNFGYCRAMWDHLNLVANTSVRYAGSLAGNLMLKYNHREFPSDIFLLLETVGATVEITTSTGSKVSVKPKAFLDTSMVKKVITKITLPPLPTSRFIFWSCKIMNRACNVKANVNAGFLLEVDPYNKYKIKKATLCFGGINPTFVHASLTESYLTNKFTNSSDTLKTALDLLYNELCPDWELPDASPEYRKQLAISLFYKFLLSLVPLDQVKSSYVSGGKLLKRPASTGKQTFDSLEKYYPLNKGFTKLEGLIQASGEAEFITDMPSVPGTLWGAMVVATKANQTISSIDASVALQYPGVTHFFQASDIPAVNNFMPPGMADVYEPEEIFCKGKVLFNGQPVGIILAENREIAERGAALVKINYVSAMTSPKPKKLLLSARDVLNSPDAKERLTQGPTKKSTPVITQGVTRELQGFFDFGMQYHFAFETQATYVIPKDGEFDVYPSSQWMDKLNTALHLCLGLPKTAFNIKVKRCGGGYGSKISRNVQVTCAAAIAAFRTKRPVRMIYTVERNMESTGKRHGASSDYIIKVNTEGVISELDITYTQPYGIALNESPVEYVAFYIPSCYNSAIYKLNGQKARTDAPKNTWCRGPGSSEGIAITENIMEHISTELGIDPIDLRLKNIPQGDPIIPIIKNFRTEIEYDARRKAIEDFNRANRWRKKGMAVCPMTWTAYLVGNFHAIVSIYQYDGTVVISHGGIEIGQGINTKAAQVAAYILGIPFDLVKVKASNNLTAANDFETGASITSESVAYAVMESCKQLLTRLGPYQTANRSWLDVINAAHADKVDLVASYMYKAGDAGDLYPVYAVVCAEVEVDLLTGNHIIQRVDLHEDVGVSMNPLIDCGQVEGALVFGMGWWTTEQIVYDVEGKLLTNRTWNYLIPTNQDIPVDFRLKFLPGRENPVGVLKSKALGEPALCLGIVAYLACRNAVGYGRQDAGLPREYFEFNTPASPENVFMAAGNDFKKYSFK